MRQFLNGVQGVDIYLTISLLIFFGFFVVMTVWLITAKKDKIQRIKNIPLNDGSIPNPKLQKS